MFVVWGTKKRVKRLGYAADFCGICRDLRSMQIERIGAASHVYGLSVGAGRLVGHLATCTECGSQRETDPALYRQLEKLDPDDPLTLLRETFPDFEKVYADRLRVEAALRRGRPIPDDAREALLREPLLQLDFEVEAAYSGSSRIDRAGVLALVAMVALPCLGGFGASVFVEPNPGSNVSAAAAGIGFALGFLSFIFCLGTSARRWLRRSILPRLGRAYAGLRAEPAELQSVLDQIGTLGLRIARKVKLHPLEEAIEASNLRHPRESVFNFTKIREPAHPMAPTVPHPVEGAEA